MPKDQHSPASILLLILQRFKDKDTFFRITHRNDPVPMVPFQSWNYAHHGDEYYIDSDAQVRWRTSPRLCSGSQHLTYDALPASPHHGYP